jgi:hypothetical protein
VPDPAGGRLEEGSSPPYVGNGLGKPLPEEEIGGAEPGGIVGRATEPGGKVVLAEVEANGVGKLLPDNEFGGAEPGGIVGRATDPGGKVVLVEVEAKGVGKLLPDDEIGGADPGGKVVLAPFGSSVVGKYVVGTTEDVAGDSVEAVGSVPKNVVGRPVGT